MSYDAAGNMTSDGLYNYVYNAENQQTSAAGATYTYDGLGRRVEKSNGTLNWYGTGSQVLAETDLSGNNFNEYAYFGGRLIARGRDSDGAAFHYFQDHLASSRVIVQYGGSSACYDAVGSSMDGSCYMDGMEAPCSIVYGAVAADLGG